MLKKSNCIQVTCEWQITELTQRQFFLLQINWTWVGNVFQELHNCSLCHPNKVLLGFRVPRKPELIDFSTKPVEKKN